MSVKLEVGDLIITLEYTGKHSVEICQYKGTTGFLMYKIKDGVLGDGVSRHQLERFVKDTDSLPYSQTIIRKGSSIYRGFVK